MKALIRDGEVVTEEDNVDWIDWRTGMPLTNPDWRGGPYTLIEDYTPLQVDQVENTTVSTKSVEIAELRARLAALENDL